MTERSKWFRVFTPRPGAEFRLVCFPYAGGSASAFRGWANLLPPTIEVVAVQYPGRQDRFDEPCMEDMAELADRIAFAATHRLRGPLVFFGHSLGASVAYETARRLERQVSPPTVVRLFASARSAPDSPRRRNLLFQSDELLMDYVRELGGSGAAVLEVEELRRLALPTLRSDFALAHGYSYSPGAPLTCPITAIAGERDPSFTPEDAELWRRHTAGDFDTRVMPGDHFYLEEAPQDLAAFLTEQLSPPVATGFQTRGISR
ncbi:thioesterase II family protein [Kitasatospora sp. NPDC059327]|uniref:thioesterase II family protein n=1 Tax=Kitasatospora sp. NPDC059327 TaxID=3346803 RepID=UPI0036A5AAE3